MRITNKMLSNNFLADMTTNLKNLKTLQKQMTTGKEISKPSDNPFKVARAMQLHTDIDTNKQYNEDIKDTINWLDTTDTALNQVGDVVQRIRELLISSGNAGYSQNERNANKDEINEKIGELGQILNTTFDGKYIFGGTRGTTKPVDVIEESSTGNSKLVYYKKGGGELVGGNEYSQIKSKLTVQVSEGVKMDYNVSASDVLEFKNGEGNTLDLREILQSITNHLDGKNSDGTAKDSDAVKKLVNGDLEKLTDVMNNVLKIRSEVGAKQNRMDSAKTKNTDANFNMTEILSKTEDIDVTEKTMEFATLQNVYLASLSLSAKIIQPTLMDYLR